MIKCVAYCRVSTKSDDQKNSLEAQKAYYLNKFNSEGYNPAKVGLLYKKGGVKEKINGIFADEGISGTSYKRREAFKSMIEYAEKKAFDVIYVKSVSRFARSVEDGTRIIKDLKEIGVAVIFEDCNLNSLDSKSEFEINLRMMLAQEESRNKSENVKWGMIRLYERGGWNGTAPYGYDVNNGFLAINEAESEVVRKVYDLFINEGNGVGKIARDLNDNGVLTRTGVKWSQQQVTRILENEIYKGVQRNHTVENQDINREGLKKVPVDVEEHIINEKDELIVIDKETFEQVQEERKRRNEMFNRHTRHSNEYKLSSLVYCAHCGGNFKRKKRHSYKRVDGTSLDIGYEWTCAINDMYGKSRCGHRNMLIEEEFLEDVKAEILKLKTCDLKGHFDLYMLVNFDYEISTEQLELLQRRREKIKGKIKQIMEDLQEELISREFYKETMKELNVELAGVEADINQIEQHDVEIENAKARYKQFLKYIQEIDVNNLTNAILKRVFSKIVVKGVTLKSGEKAKLIIYDYKLFGMGLEELMNKANQKGYNLGIKEVSVSF